MVTWELPGGTRVFALTSEIHKLSWYGQAWKYDYDFGSNLMIYLDKRPVPQGVDLVHLARTTMLQIQKRRSLLISLIDFSEFFGADTRKVLSMLSQVDTQIAQANHKYLQLDYRQP